MINITTYLYYIILLNTFYTTTRDIKSQVVIKSSDNFEKEPETT